MTSDYLLQLANATSIEGVWALHTKKMAQYNFDRIMYGFTRFHTGGISFGDINDNLVLTNHDPEYVGPFVEDRLFYHAPMVRWSLENTGAGSWSWVTEQYEAGTLTPKELKVLEFNLTMGVTAGYSISFPSTSPRSRAGMALTARRGISQDECDAMWEEHGADIEVMCNIAHMKLTSLPYARQNRPLTARQRETLEWVGDGKTIQDIASIMGLTAATVEKHLRKARETLDVETTAQAILKASFQNQIFVLEA